MFRIVSRRYLIASAAVLALLLVVAPLASSHLHNAAAQSEDNAEAAEGEEQGGEGLGKSGLPVPRFVSLKPARVNLRIGPGRDYPVSWLFMRSGLPVEIIQEYDNWRRIRDSDGTEGWVYQSLLSGKRTAIITPWAKKTEGTMIIMHKDGSEDSRIVAHVEPGVIGNVRQCNKKWCRLEINGVRGWLKQSDLWGVYPDEVFD